MSDNQKSGALFLGYILGWIVSIVQYLTIVGIMVLINYIIPGEANAWLVAVIVMLLWRNNAFVKLAAQHVLKDIEKEKEQW